MSNVIVYVHDLRSSGVVRNAIDHARRLAQDRPTTLVAGYDVGLFRQEAAAGSFAFHALGARPGLLPRPVAAVRLRRWLHRQPPSVMMSPGNMGHPTCYWATCGLDHIRRVYCISNEITRDDGLRSAIRLRWMTMLVRDAARIVLVGVAHRTVPLFASALAQGRAVELPNGVDVDLARRLATAPAPHPWLEDSVPVVLTIGRLRPQKNLDLLIAGVGLARRTRRLRLAIIGGGLPAEVERLKMLATAAGIGDDFLLAGETDNVFAWLSRASVFALPSRWEGSSVALLEALAVSAPIVASRRAGDAARVLDEGRHGLLFDGIDPSALAYALLLQTSSDVVRPNGWRPTGEASIEGYARMIRDVAAGPRATGQQAYAISEPA